MVAATTWLHARFLVPGAAEGPVMALSEPVSFWGGVDPVTGDIVDRRHPQVGATVTDAILVMPRGRGSSSASSVLAEMIRLGAAPAGILVRSADPILVLGAVVADELYGRTTPIAVLDDTSHGVAGAHGWAILEPDTGRVGVTKTGPEFRPSCR